MLSVAISPEDNQSPPGLVFGQVVVGGRAELVMMLNQF